MDGKTIHFHYDTENRLLAETTESGAPIRDYIYAANQRIALVDYQQNTQGVVYFIVNDHLSTPQLLLDTQQQVVWSVDQSPFDEVKVEGSIEQPLRFPGQYADVETGYSYNYFRDYDPTLGRYIESDPIGLEAGVNTFVYVMGNPISTIDPEGLKPPPGGSPPSVNIIHNINQARNMSISNWINAVSTYRAPFSPALSVQNGTGMWDYKNVFPTTTVDIFGGVSRMWEDYGNYHYGVVGRAKGIPGFVLEIGAGANHTTNNGLSMSRLSSFGDGVEDNYWIREGIKDYESGLYSQSCPVGM